MNAKARSFTQEKLRRRLGKIDMAIAKYMAELDRADEVLTKTGMRPLHTRLSRVIKKLAYYKKEGDALRAIETRMQSTGETQVSLTDPDCRAMATTSKQPRVVGYNVQSVVETKHHLIVAHEVTNLGYDREALSMMAQAAKDVMASDGIQAIADKGYYSGEEIVAAEHAGVAVTVPKPNNSNAGAAGRFDKADFHYAADRDAYRCPAGEWLTYRFTSELDGKMSGRTGPRRVRAARSNTDAPRARRGAFVAGSTRTSSIASRSGSTVIPERSLYGAKRSSIRSAR